MSRPARRAEPAPKPPAGGAAAAAPSACLLGVRAVPGARQTALAGWVGPDLKVRLAAPPEDGRANAALCAFLAETLGLPKGAVEVASGHASRHKRVRLTGLGEADARARLHSAAPAGPDSGA